MTVRIGFDTTKNKDTLRGKVRKAKTKRGASGKKKAKRKSYSY